MQTLAKELYYLCKEVKDINSYGGYLNNVKYAAYCIARQKGDYFHHAGEMSDRFGQRIEMKYFNLNETRNSKKITKIDNKIMSLTNKIFEIAKKVDELEWGKY
jgi:hypothetical protein